MDRGEVVSESAGPSPHASPDRRLRVARWAGWLVAVALVGFVLIELGTDRHVGTTDRVTLREDNSTAWVLSGHGRWCLAPGQLFPPATGEWDDGVLHSGRLASGTIHFDSESTASFFSDLDPDTPTWLVRHEGNRFGPCEWRDITVGSSYEADGLVGVVAE